MRKSRTTAMIAACLGAGALSLSSALPAGAAQADDTATVSVFHAVPGLTADIYANGEKLLPDVKPGTLADPQKLPAGSYDLEIFKAGANPKTADPAIEKTVEVPAGVNATIVAYLSASGTPQLNAFVNDTSAVAAGKSRLTVRHVAAAPAVDVRANGTAVFKGLVNPKEDTTEVDAGTVSADVVLAGTSTVAIGPADLNLKEGTNNIVYAWGSADQKNLALKVQTVSVRQSSPGANGAMASANSSHAWMARTAGAR